LREDWVKSNTAAVASEESDSAIDFNAESLTGEMV
jgi:hypothetical protein